MKVEIVSELKNGEEILVNSKGCEEIEIDIPVIGYLSNSIKDRTLGVSQGKGKGILFKMTKKSYKDLKKKLAQQGWLAKMDFSKA